MISSEAISKLEERIRWNEALDSEFQISLNDQNKKGDSGKHFQRFHQLVTVENIYNAGAPTPDMEAEEFNNLLADIRLQAVLQVITDAIELNPEYNPEFDYSEQIIENPAIFDNAIGFGVAVSSLELMLSSKRINPDERNVKLSAANLKLELEGFKNESGHVVSSGIKYYYFKNVKVASERFFKEKGPTISEAKPGW